MTLVVSPSQSRRTAGVVRLACSAALLTLVAATGRAQAPVGTAAAGSSVSAPASESAAAGALDASGHAGVGHVMAAPAVGRLVMDGRLDEGAWGGATVVTSFTQIDPVEGQPVSQPTTVRILFDDEALYVGAVLSDSRPVSLRLARRDANFNDSDVFAVALDSYHDHQTAFRFAINASGVKRDEVVTSTGGGGGGGDTSWDPVWEGVAHVTDSGWVAEIRIPFSQLRFGTGAVQTWGIQLERRIASNQEHAVFAFTPKRQRGGPPRYAHLTGIRGLTSGHRLELLPYTYARASYQTIPTNPSVSFGNPYRSGSDYAAGFGADLKYRLTSNITMDATVNPDFGQVEVDPAQINLSAFETRYEERRPFFVEGAEIFRFGSSLSRESQLIYSRRIGRAPQGSVPSAAAYTELPEAATILGAVKLTGKTANGWSGGLLQAVTARETAPYVDASRQAHQAVVEPATNYFAARVRRSSASGGTSVGGLATAVNRKLDDEVLTQRLRASAYVGGLDLRHEWGNRDYSLAVSAVSSLVQGSRQSILSTQRSSARYFQRPDADHLSIDTTATSLAGYSAFLAIGKFAGDWQRHVTLAATSPTYEINDLGFQTSADRLSIDANFSYRQNTPGRHLRRWDVNLSPGVDWNYGGDRVGGNLGLRGGATLLNYWNVHLNADIRPAALDDRLTRGGPLARRPGEQSVGGMISSDSRRPVTVNVQGRYGWNAAGGFSRSGEVNVGLKPASNVELRVGPEISRSRNANQYVTAVTDAVAADTYGRRYVFAELDQTTISIGTRLNVAFSPNMTLETYVQPFLSSGDYGALKELRSPRTSDFDVYGRDVGTVRRDTLGVYTVDPDGTGPSNTFRVTDRDFSFRSLRGNAVLRWEWSAGSTLFLVWQQNRASNLTATGARASDNRLGRANPYRDARELFATRPENVLQVKVTYWLNP